MRNTLGYHYVKSGYGLWLPGEDRGHWSEAWDEQIGYIEPHTLHDGDPVRKRMAEERMQHDPVRWTPAMIDAIAGAIGECEAESPWTITAASIEATHLHLLITYSRLDIERTARWLAQEMTKSVHERTDHADPVFAKGNWIGYVYDPDHWHTTQRYIEHHNQRRGDPVRLYAFITA